MIIDPAVKSVKPDAMLSSSKPDKDDIDDLMTYVDPLNILRYMVRDKAWLYRTGLKSGRYVALIMPP